ARSWWWSKYPGFMGSQMSGLWTDLGEPENHPLGMSQNLGSTERVHNIYNLLWAKTVYDGWESASPNTRVFNMTRSGFAGIQRYGVALWSGDVRKSFGGLAVQLPMLLTMGISGIGYFNSDIGGFCCGLPSAELYARWMEFGAFCPITRAHGSDRLIGTEPWVYGPEVESICRKYLQLRYRLLPYIYSMAYANMKTGLPLTWPLFFFAEPEDSCLWNESESYLWGNDLLISPVVNEGQREKTLYLPPGRWIDFETDQLYEGRQTITVAAPLDKIPVFVRDGSIIPEQPVMNYTDERPVDTLTLVGYASWQGGCAAYFDDGATLNYQNGGVAEIRATQGSKESGPPKGVQLPTYILDVQYPAHAMPGVHLPRVIDLEIHRLSAPDILSIEGGSTTEQHSLTDYRKNGGSYYDDSRHILYIRLDDLHDGLNEIMALGSKPLWK
ncbi:MAG TPA: glycoside hydrolase family 31 protein, partial [Bacteroidota bacterium]|nr:glycoside hydrolase family 31 protein [Bacteroidota bacterium]